MDRRGFLMFAGMGAVTLAGCSRPRAQDYDLPEPVQTDRTPWPVAAGMMGLASFVADILVLSRRNYPEDQADALSSVSPCDLVVAWGPAAKADARKAMRISQASRRMLWRSRTSDMDIPGVRQFTRYSGNWHMIPATPEIAADLERVAVGDVVRIVGDLVQVTFTNGVYYRSSMSRDDVGDGACEIIRATSIVVDGGR